MAKFWNKYRIPSARLKNWDYRSNAAYFITICTAGREHYFGEIKNGVMHLDDLGELAKKFWLEIPDHFPFVHLGNFVAMPNHVHGILIINKPSGYGATKSNGVPLPGVVDSVETLQCNVSTESTRTESTRTESTPTESTRTESTRTEPTRTESTRTESTRTEPTKMGPNESGSVNSSKNEFMSKIAPKPGSVSTIIRSYKSVVSKHAHKTKPDFGWQPRFHDHIIRDAEAYERIQTYIANNPKNWKEDRFF